MSDDAQAIAERSVRALLDGDEATRSLGMELVEFGPGRSHVRMRIREDMVNGHGTCHGGLIFTLADSALAVACNSREQAMVAQHCTITFLNPARLGDVLDAVGEERTLEGRTGVYDITVRRDDGKMIAEFRGVVRSIPGKVTDAGHRERNARSN